MDGHRQDARATLWPVASSAQPFNLRHSIGWLLHYALRRWRAMAVVLGAMVLKIGLDLLKPWPMKILLDYVLKELPRPAIVTRMIDAFPGDHSRPTLVLWCVAAT